jgi:hypothetical protein
MCNNLINIENKSKNEYNDILSKISTFVINNRNNEDVLNGLNNGNEMHTEHKLHIFNGDPLAPSNLKIRQNRNTPTDSNIESYYESLTDVSFYQSMKNKSTDANENRNITYLLGLGGTGGGDGGYPSTIVSLSNIMCYYKIGLDQSIYDFQDYQGESTFIHEFAHTIQEVGIQLGNNELYDIFNQISVSFKDYNSDHCSAPPDVPYDCITAELFAEATQVWFGVATVDNYFKKYKPNDKIDTIDKMKEIKITTSNNHNITSLYDYMKLIYGEPPEKNEICNENYPMCDFCKKSRIN